MDSSGQLLLKHLIHSLAPLPLEPPITNAANINPDIPLLVKRSRASNYNDKNLQPSKRSNLTTTCMLIPLPLLFPFEMCSHVAYTQIAC